MAQKYWGTTSWGINISVDNTKVSENIYFFNCCERSSIWIPDSQIEELYGIYDCCCLDFEDVESIWRNCPLGLVFAYDIDGLAKGSRLRWDGGSTWVKNVHLESIRSFSCLRVWKVESYIHDLTSCESSKTEPGKRLEVRSWGEKTVWGNAILKDRGSIDWRCTTRAA